MNLEIGQVLEFTFDKGEEDQKVSKVEVVEKESFYSGDYNYWFKYQEGEEKVLMHPELSNDTRDFCLTQGLVNTLMDRDYIKVV